MPKERQPKRPKALVLTALPVEYKAVQAQLGHIEEVTHPKGTVYEIGDFTSYDRSTWSICIAEIGAGNVAAAAETERAVSYFQPDVIIFVGIAGGLKDVAIGDVVAATKVYGYESGKVAQEFLSRPDVHHSSYELEQRARAEAKKENWVTPAGSFTRRSFTAVVAPIVSGEKVVTSRQSELFQFIRTRFSDAVAVEMEGTGFMFAGAANAGVRTLVIRGVSDLVENKTATDEAGSQEIAAKHASAFAFQILSKLTFQRKRTARVATIQPKPFKRDQQVESLIHSVRFGELKTASRPALEIIRKTSANGNNELFEKLLAYQDCFDEDEMFWKALTTIEACCELAPSLMHRPAMIRMASSENFSVRSSLAFICMNFAQFAPSLVPLDIIEKLSVHDEDWYVQAPANAALKAMVRAMPAVLFIFFFRLHSSDEEERAHAAHALLEIAEKEPELLDENELRFEIVLMEKLGDRNATTTLKSAIAHVQKVQRREGYKYGI